MASGNDAAYALARVGGGAGGVPQTLRAMNARAAQLGAFDTVARDPAGLDRPGQSSSAYDLALIGRAAMQLPDLRRYVTTKHVSFPGGTGPDGKARRAFVINNHNRLLYNYPGTIGIKNGYTVAAKQTFIGAASRGRPHLPAHRDGRHQRQLAPDGGPAGLGLRPRHPPGPGGPARAAGQHRAAVRAGRRSSRPAGPRGPPPGGDAGPRPRRGRRRRRPRWE